ncbi:type I methionyl aminopeptidase [Nocardioides sp. zg-ZUI104]|uniref:type I methionyl aminopeptidase n=1 Tax=Nocardioides faecalis TaxID=2803858 RepID=UPI001BD099B4|nr:type I methionyl aminopeptidase [Nocardioides faecalis]MBS4753610.1 type I methionyl aminopeptidase [Nocardioides faecalis]
MFFDQRIEIKTPEQVRAMRAAGLVVGRTLELLRDAVRPGVSTAELDALAAQSIRDAGALPSFLGYGDPPFPATICTSVNDAVVHGIPGGRVLAEGDVVSIDCGAIVDGWHGDAAITVAVGEVRDDVRELMRVTEEALWRGLAAARVGGRVGDISAAVETYVVGQGAYGIVDGYTGHGIGTSMHMDPDVPNRGRAGRGPRLKQGIALAVEPMISLGSCDSVLAEDDWTVLTDDGSWAAHFEHTFALTERGVWVLTAEDGGRARLEALGAPYGGED